MIISVIICVSVKLTSITFLKKTEINKLVKDD